MFFRSNKNKIKQISDIKLNPQIIQITDSQLTSLKHLDNQPTTNDILPTCKYQSLSQSDEKFNKKCLTKRSYQSFQKENQIFLLMTIFKGVSFGLLFSLILFTLLYDKVFFKRHYYSGKESIILTQPSYWKQNILNMYHKQSINSDDKLSAPNINEFRPFSSITPWTDSGASTYIMNYDNMYNQYNPFNPNQNNPSKPMPPTNYKGYHEINNQNLQDKYNLQSPLMNSIINEELPQNVQLNKYSWVTKLLQVNHNVDFKGNIIIEQTYYEKNDEDMQKKKKRIQGILELQRKYYEDKYEISKYHSKQLPFCLVVPSYNNVKNKLYLRNLDSIFMQNYSNYHVVYIDDASPDNTGEFVKKYVEDRKIPIDKISIIINQKNVMALTNIYNAIHDHCKSGEIVMLIDGDDSFIGRQVMSTFNAAYQKDKAGLVYSQYLTITGNRWAGLGGSSMPIPEGLLKQNKFRNARNFFTSHLLTFYADLFKMIDKKDLQYENGTFFDFAYDVALVTPIIEMVNPRIKFIEQTNYEYRYDTGINDPGWGQIQVTDIIFSKPAYKRLEEFPFIDDFYKQS